MNTNSIAWGVMAAAFAAGWTWNLPVQAATKADQARTAAKLVQETLEREAKEGVDDRAELLKPVMEQSPNCEAVRWQSGFLYDPKQKEWLRWDEAERRAGEDKQLATYRQTRSNRADTIDGQLSLARWCLSRKLEDQARAHLTRMLELNPDQAEARNLLGYRFINGTWVSERDMAEAKERVRKASADLANWMPRLEKLYDQLGAKSRKQQDNARRELAAIRDPDAALAIEAVFCARGGEDALLGVELLKNVQASEAAAALAWEAVSSPWGPVRAAAAAALKGQRKHDYVPLLLGAMRSPVQARFALYTFPNGDFLVRRALYQEGPEQRELAVSDVAHPSVVVSAGKSYVFSDQHPGNGYLTRQEAQQVISKLPQARADDAARQKADQAEAQARALAQLGVQQALTKAAIYANNLSAANLNARLCSVLATATDAPQPMSPESWYTWWDDYNEVTSQGDKPMIVTYQFNAVPTVSVATTPTVTRCSCLVAGTPVWTETGPVPVEQLRLGDRVLACDSDSGRLALKPVLKTIVNPGRPILRLHTGTETLGVTGGHTFWISGKGWLKARELQPEMRFHTLTGTVCLDRVEPAAKQDTFNLVVADFHTYFVGRQRLLTHDNTIRKPTNCIVPGLEAHVAAEAR